MPRAPCSTSTNSHNAEAACLPELSMHMRQRPKILVGKGDASSDMAVQACTWIGGNKRPTHLRERKRGSEAQLEAELSDGVPCRRCPDPPHAAMAVAFVPFLVYIEAERARRLHTYYKLVRKEASESLAANLPCACCSLHGF